jgi:hypothetical protein
VVNDNVDGHEVSVAYRVVDAPTQSEDTGPSVVFLDIGDAAMDGL